LADRTALAQGPPDADDYVRQSRDFRSEDERKTVAGKKDVALLEVHPIGNYAARLIFDDMHSTGIYSWDYLLELGRERDAYWQDYLDELAGKGLKR
jgi:DUF971 family protein